MSIVPNSNFQAAANGAVIAAEQLFGCNSFEALQTDLAWRACGVNPPQPQIEVVGTTYECANNLNDFTINLSSCFQNGATFFWNVSEPFSTSTSGSGNSNFSFVVPQGFQGSINVSVLAIAGGAPDWTTHSIFIGNCGGDINGNPQTAHSILLSSASFKLYPNPTSGETDINIPMVYKDNSLEILIFNSVGQQVYQRKIGFNDSHLHLADLPKGLYNIIVRNLSDRKIITTLKQ